MSHCEHCGGEHELVPPFDGNRHVTKVPGAHLIPPAENGELMLRLSCDCLYAVGFEDLPLDPSKELECQEHGTRQLHVGLQAALYTAMLMVDEED